MIPAGIAELLEPLERFEALRRKAARLGDRLADLSYANPYGGAQESARAALRAALEEERPLDLQYAPFGGQTLARRAVADHLADTQGLPFAFDDVVLTPGAMAALHLALHTAGEPGDEVVIPVPCWLDYPVYALATNRVPVLVPVRPDTFDLDVDAIAGALTDRTCAVLLSQPANPTGRSYPDADIAELAAVIKTRSRVTLVADETHRDFAPGHRSPAHLVERTLVVYSFGKYHFLQGQRTGYVATSPHHPDRKAIAAELVRWTRITGVNTPTSLMQRALPALLALRHDLTWVDVMRTRVCDELMRSGYEVVRPDGTLFVYVRTPGDRDDLEFVGDLATKGVLVMPAPVFHHQGWFRLALTGSEEMVDRALAVLSQAHQ